jgi:inner membrane protein
LEPITHFLTGACLSRAGFNRKTALATATMTLAAEAPDLDVLGNLKGPVFGFAHHRGFTHSFLGSFLVAAVVVGLVYALWCVRGRKTRNPNLPPRWGLLYCFAVLASLSHVLLDFTNNYGVRPLWPFSERWYSWDIVFIVEPVIFVLLLAGLVLPAFFALIDKEIGVRRESPPGRFGATLALIGVVAMWGVRDFEHRRAVNALEAQTYEGADPLRVSAYPYWWTPFTWYGVVETQTLHASMRVDSLSPEVDPRGEMRVLYKPEETPVTLAAKKSYLGQVYLDWAKYPVTETEQVEFPQPGFIVRFKDLRYDYPERRGQNILRAAVRLDRNLNVVAEGFGSRWTRRGQALVQGEHPIPD